MNLTQETSKKPFTERYWFIVVLPVSSGLIIASGIDEVWLVEHPVGGSKQQAANPLEGTQRGSNLPKTDVYGRSAFQSPTRHYGSQCWYRSYTETSLDSRYDQQTRAAGCFRLGLVYFPLDAHVKSAAKIPCSAILTKTFLFRGKR